jgi:cytidylate kinase
MKIKQPLTPKEAIMQPTQETGPFSLEAQLKQYRSYLATHVENGKQHGAVHGLPPPGPAITISHQTGSGAHEIASRLAGLLQASETKGSIPWTVFDRNLLEKVLVDHDLPRALAEFIPEDHRSYLQDAIDEMLGVIPPSWDILPQITQTILHLADVGHVILVGRGASFITARMPHVFHVRLVASLAKRIARVQELNHLTLEAATTFIEQEDGAHGRYVKGNFHVGIDDDHLYHLVLNTDRFPCPEAAQLIANGAHGCFHNTVDSGK